MEITVEKRKILEWDVVMWSGINELNEEHVCIVYDGDGGPIISGPNFMAAEKKFIEAMHLAVSVQKLMTFKETGHF